MLYIIGIALPVLVVSSFQLVSRNIYSNLIVWKEEKTNSWFSVVVRNTIYCRSSRGPSSLVVLSTSIEPLTTSFALRNPAKWCKTHLFITQLTLATVALVYFAPAFTPHCYITPVSCKWTAACAQNYQDPTGRQTDRQTKRADPA